MTFKSRRMLTEDRVRAIWWEEYSKMVKERSEFNSKITKMLQDFDDSQWRWWKTLTDDEKQDHVHKWLVG